jgi:hypothetical protein
MTPLLHTRQYRTERAASGEIFSQRRDRIKKIVDRSADGVPFVYGGGKLQFHTWWQEACKKFP